MNNISFLYILCIILGLIILSIYHEYTKISKEEKLLKKREEDKTNKKEVKKLDRPDKSEFTDHDEKLKITKINKIPDDTYQASKPVEVEEPINKRRDTFESLETQKNVIDNYIKETSFEFPDYTCYENLDISELINHRNIDELVHFTNIENLYSIITNGFVPVSLQEKFGIKGRRNDRNRYDRKLNTTSFSVGFPNYKMFYKLRKTYHNCNWVVIAIDPKILYLHKDNIYYYESNAASNDMSDKKDYELQGKHAFGSMFKEEMYTCNYGEIYRDNLNIKEGYSTDPQAEILIEGHIPNKFIRSIYIKDASDYTLIKRRLGSKIWNYDIDINPNYFKPRSDYRFWIKTN